MYSLYVCPIRWNLFNKLIDAFNVSTYTWCINKFFCYWCTCIKCVHHLLLSKWLSLTALSDTGSLSPTGSTQWGSRRNRRGKMLPHERDVVNGRVHWRGIGDTVLCHPKPFWRNTIRDGWRVSCHTYTGTSTNNNTWSVTQGSFEVIFFFVTRSKSSFLVTKVNFQR